MTDPATIAAICAGALSLVTAFGTFLMRMKYEEILCCFGMCDFKQPARSEVCTEQVHRSAA